MKHRTAFLREINRNNVCNHETLYISFGGFCCCCFVCFVLSLQCVLTVLKKTVSLILALLTWKPNYNIDNTILTAFVKSQDIHHCIAS